MHTAGGLDLSTQTYLTTVNWRLSLGVEDVPHPALFLSSIVAVNLMMSSHAVSKDVRHMSDEQLRQMLIQRSIYGYFGPCACP